MAKESNKSKKHQNRKGRIIGTIHSHVVKHPNLSKTDVNNLSIGITLIYSKRDKRIRAFKINKKVDYEEVQLVIEQ